MQHGISTYYFESYRLSIELLHEIERARIPLVEIFCVGSHFDYRNAEAVRELAEWFADHALKLHALHAPTSRDLAPGRESTAPISISDPERVRRLDAVDEVKRALDVAEKIPFPYLVQHLGSGREGDTAPDPRLRDAAFNSLEHLAIFAKQRGVTIALENTPGGLATPSYLRHFIQETRLADLRLCFDVGHAHVEDGVERSFETMREMVVTTHLHDNHGERDEHLLPFEGTVDWTAALKALNTAPDAGNLPAVLELKEPAAGAHTAADYAKILEQAGAAFSKLEQILATKG
jgi:sugar phosphate isomerase/epimerase